MDLKRTPGRFDEEVRGSDPEPTILAGGPIPTDVAMRLQPFGSLVVAPGGDEEALIRFAGSAVAIIARGDTQVTRRVIESAPRLRVIGRSGVGVDLVDVEEATRRGIPVVITPGSGSNAVAEGAVAMMLVLLKNLRRLDALVRSGRWAERESVPVGDLEGSVLGVVGLGRIGERVARLGLSHGMRVLAHDPEAQARRPPVDVEWTSLPDLLSTSDVVSLHVPLTPSTRSLIDRDRLMSMKTGAILLNLSRGAVISSNDDLWDALDAVPLGGVGLDTFSQEPPDVSHPLFQDERVLLSPHVLGLSHRARGQIFADMSEAMARVLEGKPEHHVANPEVWTAASADRPTA